LKYKYLFFVLLIVLNSCASTQENSKTASFYILRGISYNDIGDYDRAILEFTRAIQLNPFDADAYFLRAATYKNKKDYEKAIADYTQAIIINPDYITAYILRSSAYHSKGDLDRALAGYNQAIQLAPNDANAYMGRAYVYGDKGDTAKAIADFTRVIQLEPNNILAYNNRGIGYAIINDYERAINDWESILRIDPNNSTARQNIERVRKEQIQNNNSNNIRLSDGFDNLLQRLFSLFDIKINNYISRTTSGLYKIDEFSAIDAKIQFNIFARLNSSQYITDLNVNINVNEYLDSFKLLDFIFNEVNNNKNMISARDGWDLLIQYMNFNILIRIPQTPNAPCILFITK